MFHCEDWPQCIYPVTYQRTSCLPQSFGSCVSPSSPSGILWICYTYCSCPSVLGHSVFLNLCFQLSWILWIHLSSSSEILSSVVFSLLTHPSDTIFIFIQCILSPAFPGSFSGCPSLCFHDPSDLVCSLLHPLQPVAYHSFKFLVW